MTITKKAVEVAKCEHLPRHLLRASMRVAYANSKKKEDIKKVVVAYGVLKGKTKVILW